MAQIWPMELSAGQQCYWKLGTGVGSRKFNVPGLGRTWLLAAGALSCDLKTPTSASGLQLALPGPATVAGPTAVSTGPGPVDLSQEQPWIELDASGSWAF